MTLPKSRTVISSQTLITRSMWCSTSITDIRSVRLRTSVAELVHLRRSTGRWRARRAAAASGSATSARASATRLRTAYGRLRRVAVGVLRDAEVARTASGALAELALLADAAGKGQQRAEEAGAGVPVGADHDVLQHGHPVEEAEALQGARDAEPGELVRAQAGQLVAASDDACRRRA